jgi:hypothetical protein
MWPVGRMLPPPGLMETIYSQICSVFLDFCTFFRKTFYLIVLIVVYSQNKKYYLIFWENMVVLPNLIGFPRNFSVWTLEVWKLKLSLSQNNHHGAKNF